MFGPKIVPIFPVKNEVPERDLARGGGGSESSDSSDEEYDKAGSAFALRFLINIRSDQVLALWCFGAFFLRFLKFKNANLRTDLFSCTFSILRTCNRTFFESILSFKNVSPTVFGIRASYERDAPVKKIRSESGRKFR